jgi:hypothetical protein
MNLQHHQLALPWYDLIDNEANENQEEDNNNNIQGDQTSEVLPECDGDSNQWLELLFDWFQSENSEASVTQQAIRSQIQELLDNGTTTACDTDKSVLSKWELFQSISLPIRYLLASFLRSKKMADLSICVPEQSEILCHQCILTLNSEFFKALFSEEWSMSSSEEASAVRKVNCDDANSVHVQYLLRCLYGEDIFSLPEAMSVHDAVGVYSLAHYWSCSSSVLESLLDYIYNCVEGETAVYVLTFAETYSLSQLKDKCFTLAIQEMTTSISLDDSVLSSDIQACMLVLRRACKFVKSKHNLDVTCSVREVVGMLKESLLEEEEVWKVSSALHVEAMQHCTRGGGGGGDEAYKERLCKVQESLDKQELAMRQRRAFYEQQQESLNQLGL